MTTSAATSTREDPSFTARPATGPASSAGTASAAFIPETDAFAKARVGNFVKRWQESTQTTSAAALKPTTVAATESDLATERPSLRCTQRAELRLPLPAPYDTIAVAVGWGATRVEAESAAFVHAERIIDAHGMALFAMTSKQQRHADAAVKAGRWAPGPAEVVKPEGPGLSPFQPAPVAVDPAECGQGVSSSSGPAASGFATIPVGPGKSSPSSSSSTPFVAGGMANTGTGLSRNAKGRTRRMRRILNSLAPTSSHQDLQAHGAGADGDEGAASSVVILAEEDVEGSASPLFSGLPPFKQPSVAEDENGSWRLVITRAHFRPAMANAIGFACLVDHSALDRIVKAFAQRGADFHADVVVVTSPFDGISYHVASVRLPLGRHMERSVVDDSFSAQDIVDAEWQYAKGKASTREVAIRLCAMHAELLFDAVGEPLFPKDLSAQLAHAADAWAYGRFIPWDRARTARELEFVEKSGVSDADLDEAAAHFGDHAAIDEADEDAHERLLRRRAAELRIQRMRWTTTSGEGKQHTAAAAACRWYPDAWFRRDAADADVVVGPTRPEIPLPLKELSGHMNDNRYETHRIAPRSPEERFTASHDSFVIATSLVAEIDASALEDSVVDDGVAVSTLLRGFRNFSEAEVAVTRFQARHAMRPRAFLTAVSQRGHGYNRCSLIVAAPDSVGHLAAFATWPGDSTAPTPQRWMERVPAACKRLALLGAVEAVYAAGLPLFAGKSCAEEIDEARRVERARREHGLVTVEMSDTLPTVTPLATKSSVCRMLRGAEIPSDVSIQRSAGVFAPALRHVEGRRYPFLPPSAHAGAMFRLDSRMPAHFTPIPDACVTKAFASAYILFEDWYRACAIANGTFATAEPLRRRTFALVSDNTRVSQTSTSWMYLPVDLARDPQPPEAEGSDGDAAGGGSKRAFVVRSVESGRAFDAHRTDRSKVLLVAVGRAMGPKDSDRLCILHAVKQLIALGYPFKSAAHVRELLSILDEAGREIGAAPGRFDSLREVGDSTWAGRWDLQKGVTPPLGGVDPVAVDAVPPLILASTRQKAVWDHKNPDCRRRTLSHAK